MSSVLMCPRCAFITFRKADMTRHLNKKTLCPALFKNLTKEQCIEKLFNEKSDVMEDKQQIKLINKNDEIIVDNHANTKSTNQMNVISCPRCAFITIRKADMLRHLNKKTICSMVLKNLTKEQCIEKLFNKKKIKLINKNIKLMGINSVQMCKETDCRKKPRFNVEGSKSAMYCSIHKKLGMVDMNHKTCLECKKIPTFNVEGTTNRLYCAVHKKTGMVNVKDQSCKSEWCSTLVQHKYDGYCLFCYMNLFPDKPVSRNYKTKEYSVVEYVKNQFPNLDWISDKQIIGGCSKRRPDLLLDLGYQIVIIEIDENQHTGYDCSCDNKRIMELSQDLGHRPIVFIRFNPDDYEKDGTNISSCWGRNKNGICVVKKTNEWIQRLNTLEEQIKYWVNPINVTTKTIETIQLYYDDM